VIQAGEKRQANGRKAELNVTVKRLQGVKKVKVDRLDGLKKIL
jgi:hypothetical protein